MTTRPMIGNFLSVALALTLTGFLGCRKQEQSKPTPDRHGAHGGGQTEAMLMVTTEPAAIKPGEAVKLNLMIHGADGGMVKNFEVVHENKVHLIIVRDGLDQFAHIHPDRIASDGNITASFTFPTGGKYRLYADYKPAGKEQATATAELKVTGDSPPAAELTTNVPGKVDGDGLDADISIENAKAGMEARISFALLDQSGKLVTDLQSYLGAMGHFVVISADGNQYVHAHAMEGKSASSKVEFMAHFLNPGIYKGWGQFQRAGKVHVVPFVVKVD